MAGALLPSTRGLCTRPAQQQVKVQRLAQGASAAAAHGRRLRLRAATGQAPTDQLSLAELKAGLEEAVNIEDYSTAAMLRDRIRKHPVTVTEEELEVAVREERFEEAARLRDQLQELQPLPPPPPSIQSEVELTATTTSDCVTDGIRVTCRSFFVPHQSRPAAGSYFFAYDIRIQNDSSQTIKVMERFWKIHDGMGRRQEVRGAGVVGEQPELAPGEHFAYQSACPLPTPSGTMEGHYEVYARDEVSGQWRKSFLVKIGRFGLLAQP